MNNTLEGNNSRIIEAEGQRKDLKDRMAEITAMEQNIEKNEKKLRLDIHSQHLVLAL